MAAAWALICIILLSCVAVILAQAPGFLSLNCGGNSYTDPTDAITWIPDNSFIISGSNSTVQLPLHNISVPLQTLRYFPGQLPKYCYRLPNLTFNASYYLRASFLYGNYDGLQTTSLPLSFSLLLDSDLWAEISIESTQAEIVSEIYVTAQHTFLDVCLARDASSQKPFISTLELRPLNRTMYSDGLQNGFALYTAFRTNWGAISSVDYKYPADKFDRIWYHNSNAPKISTTHPISVSTVPEKPPSPVMQTAFGNASLPNSTFEFPLTGVNYLYVALFFAEIGNVTRPGERVFDIYVNGVNQNGITPWFAACDVFNLTHQHAYRILEVYGEVTVNGSLVVTLAATAKSKLGPMLGASEILIYSQAQYQNGTLQADVDAATKIQQDFLLQEQSTGDPCLPIGFGWNWLNCSTDSPPRITSLLLSGRNISGSVSEHITSLTALTVISLANNSLTGAIPSWDALTNLQHLDLDNNHFSGSIPLYLENLKFLTDLFLENNELSGNIPLKLLQESADGTLHLRLSGNPNLNCSGSTPTACSLAGISQSSPAPAMSPIHHPSNNTSAAAMLNFRSMFTSRIYIWAIVALAIELVFV